jgi:hypothetical protein
MWFYATSRKAAGSTPDVVIEYFLLYLVLPAAVIPGVYSASNRYKYNNKNSRE